MKKSCNLNFYIKVLSMLTFAVTTACLSSYQAIATQTIPPIITFIPLVSQQQIAIQPNAVYVAPNGSDSNPGTLNRPWKTVDKAVRSVTNGGMIVLRAGQYPTINGGWDFVNSGTSTSPITLTNYPNEQAILKISQSSHDYMAFRCWSTPTDPADWQTTKADYIHIIGTDVSLRTLPDGVTSRKGLVILGAVGEQGAGIEVAGCSYWEVAGVDFVEVAYGIFTKKRNFQSLQNSSPVSWYVHDNRVYNYYRESGMQFNGDFNRIQNNEIYKVSNTLSTPYGCQLLNISGHDNTISSNTLSRLGSTAACGGVLLEWDLADNNLFERNEITDVPWAFSIAGGDNNILRNNVMIGGPDQKQAIKIYSYDAFSAWPCNESTDDVDAVPANNPTAPDYKYYYNPRNCHSSGNLILNNTTHGFSAGVYMTPLPAENTVIRNNLFADSGNQPLCFAQGLVDICNSTPATVTNDHNADQPDSGFLNIAAGDLHLTSASPLIGQGMNIFNLVPDDFDGRSRSANGPFDIGAYIFTH
jgi:hypothetical protein